MDIKKIKEISIGDVTRVIEVGKILRSVLTKGEIASLEKLFNAENDKTKNWNMRSHHQVNITNIGNAGVS